LILSPPRQGIGKANAQEEAFLHRSKCAKPDKKGAWVLSGAPLSAAATLFFTELAQTCC